jgi:hypothetical protein
MSKSIDKTTTGAVVSPGSMRLPFELWLLRTSPWWGVPCMAIVLWCIAHFMITPWLQTDLSKLVGQRAALRTQLQQSADRAAPASPIEASMQSLSPVLPAAHELDQIFRTLFQGADSHALLVKEALYRSESDGGERLRGVHVVVPVRGTYPAIRSWIEETLAANPSLSLDDIAFKRDSVAAGQLEVSVAFTLWHRAAERSARQLGPAT